MMRGVWGKDLANVWTVTAMAWSWLNDRIRLVRRTVAGSLLWTMGGTVQPNVPCGNNDNNRAEATTSAETIGLLMVRVYAYV